MQNRRLLLRVIATTVVVTGLSFLLVVDARNLSRGPATMSAQGYLGGYYNESPLPPSQQYEAPPDLSGSVTGSLVDEDDGAIRGIEVELIPVDKTGDQRWYATHRDWTNAEGQYAFPRIEPGEYILAVQERGAPDGRHPFAGAKVN